jgi:hypothetical protein
VTYLMTHSYGEKIHHIIKVLPSIIGKSHKRLLEMELEMEGFARFGGAQNLAEGPTKKGPNSFSDFWFS